MDNNFTHNPRKVYHLVVLMWVILFVAVMTGIVAVDLQRAEKKFADHTNMCFQQVNERVRINETVLEGFSAMISAANDMDRTRIRIFAQQMLKQYPHIFKFEIVEKVPYQKLETFTEYYRQHLHPDFEVKAFSYETDRQWQVVKKMPYHLPIVFMEPITPQSRKVLGLDIGSNAFFMHSFRASEQQQRMLSTEPFTLVQGHLAYLLHRPIAQSINGEKSAFSKSGAQGGFAELVIRADTLLDSAAHILPGMRVLLYRPPFSSTDPKGYLHRYEAEESGWLESRLFPRLSLSRSLDSESQPFVLLIEQQLGWSIISWGKLGLTLLMALTTFAVVIVYARLYYQSEMQRAETTVRLFHLANHDALTGLANRNLLNDRLSHAISQTARQRGQLAVLFLDVEEFKAVNDTYGHEIGDGILKRAAERLRACVRAGDTIARMGGDEFVLVLENIDGQIDVDHVIDKIKTGFEQPFYVDTESIKLGITVGSAIYPENGTDMDALIRYADCSMYRNKPSD